MNMASDEVLASVESSVSSKFTFRPDCTLIDMCYDIIAKMFPDFATQMLVKRIESNHSAIFKSIRSALYLRREV